MYVNHIAVKTFADNSHVLSVGGITYQNQLIQHAGFAAAQAIMKERRVFNVAEMVKYHIFPVCASLVMKKLVMKMTGSHAPQRTSITAVLVELVTKTNRKNGNFN